MNAPFTVNLAPAAVADPVHGRAIVYHAFRAGRPVLRMYDAERRRDRILAPRTFSFAWRRDGTMAYFQGLRGKVDDITRYRGHVVVRPGITNRTIRWTPRPGAYAVAAWARDALVIYRRSRVTADLFVLDRPGRSRLLARNAFLVALSPDGTQAFVSRPDASGATVELVDIASGRSTGTRPARDRPSDGRQPTTFVASGSWVGDRVIGATNLGLAIYRVDSGRIALAQTLDVDLNRFPLGLQEPQADDSSRRIVAWAELQSRPRQAVPNVALVECDRTTLACRQSRPAPGLQPPRIIYNPSRP